VDLWTQSGVLHAGIAKTLKGSNLFLKMRLAHQKTERIAKSWTEAYQVGLKLHVAKQHWPKQEKMANTPNSALRRQISAYSLDFRHFGATKPQHRSILVMCWDCFCGCPNEWVQNPN
jgi:hypothetical protein